MGRRSRELRRRRQERARGNGQGARPGGGTAVEPGQSTRISELVNRLKEVDGEFELNGSLSPEAREAHLKDVLAFESVSTGTSLFQGLEQHGVQLPRPESLDEPQCSDKISEVLEALAGVCVLLVGYERMSPRKFYSTLWNETLWEGCYLENRPPGSLTVIDVSHSLSRSDWKSLMEELGGRQTVQ